jgi:hypothetical protein
MLRVLRGAVDRDQAGDLRVARVPEGVHRGVLPRSQVRPEGSVTDLERLILARADEQVRATDIREVRKGYRHAHKQRCRACETGLAALWSKSRLCARCRSKG